MVCLKLSNILKILYQKGLHSQLNDSLNRMPHPMGRCSLKETDTLLRAETTKANCPMNIFRNRRKFTQEFKDDTVSLVIDQGYSCAEVDRSLGVSNNNVNRWVREYRQRNEIESTDGLSREQMQRLRLHSTLGYLSQIEY